MSAFPEEVTPAERALLKRRTVLIMVAVSTTVLLLVADLTLLCFFASGANKSFSVDLTDTKAQIALAVSIPVVVMMQLAFVLRMFDAKPLGESPEVTSWMRKELGVLKRARRSSLAAIKREEGTAVTVAAEPGVAETIAAADTAAVAAKAEDEDVVVTAQRVLGTGSKVVPMRGEL